MTLKLLINDLKTNLEIEKNKKYNKLAERYILRPISIYLAIPFAILKIKANNVTYLRAAILVFLFAFTFFINPSDYKYILFGAIFCQILDYVDGNLARYYKTTSVYGKFLDGLFDSLLPIVYIALPLLNQKINNNLVSLEVDFLIINFVIISFFFANIFDSRRVRFEYLVEISKENKTSKSSIEIDRKKLLVIKNIFYVYKKVIDLLNQTHLIVSAVLSVFNLQQLIILYLLFVRILDFTLMIKTTISIKKRWLGHQY